MKICQITDCTRPSARSAIIVGKYYSRICAVHYGIMMRAQAPSSGHAVYNRQRDFEDHQSDAVQPYDKEGNPHPDFIKLYPDKAREMWDEETMRRFS
jgi:hypothetical protein